MRRTSYIVSGLLVTAALAWALLVGLVVAVGEPRGLTNAAAEWALTRATGAPTTIRGSSGSLLRGLELDGIEVGQGDLPALGIDTVRLEIEPRALLDGRIEVRLLRLVGLSIEGVEQEDGRWRWAGGLVDPGEETGAPTEAGAAPRSVVVHAIELEDARFRLAWAPGTGPDRLDARLDAELHDLVWPFVDTEGWLPRFDARLSELEVSGGRFPVRSGELAAHHDAGDIVLSARDIQGPWGSVERAEVETRVEGGIEAPRIDGGHADAEFSGLDPGRVLEGDWPASTISGRTDFDWQQSDATGALHLEPFTLFGVAVDGADARGRLWIEDGTPRFDLESFHAVAPEGEVQARVSGDLERADRIVVEQARLDVAMLPPEWRPDGFERGAVSMEATLSGPWDALTGDFTLHVDGLTHSDLGAISGELDATLLARDRVRVRTLRLDPARDALPTVRSTTPFVVAFADDIVTFEGARLDLDSGRLEIDGGVGSDRFVGLRVRTDGLDLARALRGQGGPEVGGTLVGDLRVDGPLHEPELAGDLDWRSPQIGALTADRARFSLSTDIERPAQRVAIQLVRDADLALDAEATFSMRGVLERPAALLDDASLRLAVEAHDLDVGILAAAAGVDVDRLEGQLNARMTAGGPLREPFVAGRVDWTDVVWRDLHADRISAAIRSSDETGDAHFELGVVQQGETRIRGVFDVRDRRLLTRPRQLLSNPESAVLVELDGFDLTSLEPLLVGTGLVVRGVANGSLRVAAGPIPDAHGEIRISALQITGPGLPVEVGPTPLRLDLMGHMARSTEILIPSSDGAAYVRGQVSWEDPADPQIQIRARSQAYAVELPGIIDGRLDGDAVVYGTPASLYGEGGLLLHHARIDLPDPEDPILEEITVKYTASPDTDASLRESRERGTLYDVLEGQLSLQVGESVWLRGVGAELELRGELVARKSRGEPAGLYGSVEVVSGRIDFQGKWLRVTSGSALFDGNADPDPYIDATAVHRVGEVTIRARLFGRASMLALELDSDPPMSAEDQLSYLLFDRPVSQIGVVDQQNVGAIAAMLAGDFLLGRVGTELLQEIGIDRVRLGVDENDSPTIEIEKQIHERVALRYGRGFGAEGGDRFIIEWRVFRKLFLSGEQLTNGESGVDVFWRFDY